MTINCVACGRETTINTQLNLLCSKCNRAISYGIKSIDMPKLPTIREQVAQAA